MGTLENFLGKKFPTPVLKPMAPFFIAGGIIFYGVNAFSKVLANSNFAPRLNDPDEFRNDHRNPNAAKNAASGQ